MYKTKTRVWSKLEGLNLTKYLVNCLYLKQALYSFKMREDIVLTEQLDTLNKLILDLKNINVSIDDEDQVLLLLCFFYLSLMLISKKLSRMEEILWPLKKFNQPCTIRI